MRQYFTISEFIVDRGAKNIPIHVADKLLAHHISIINPIRHKLSVPVVVSDHSGYRSFEWEVNQGRSGTSQHTFVNSLGAVDYTSSKLTELLEELKASDYKRVCYYTEKGFIHCDHKGQEFIYCEDYSDGNGWKYIGKRR